MVGLGWWGGGCGGEGESEQREEGEVVLNGFYQFRFHCYTSSFITILLLQDSKYSIWNTYYLEYLLFGMVAIWNTLILYWFHHVTMVSLITYILQIQHCT